MSTYSNYLNPEESFDDAMNSLKHYGRLGMKWGVMNGPPYPLNSSTMSASEKKASSKKKDKDKDKSKPSPHPDYLKAHDKKDVKYLSDAELADRNRRLGAERQYKQYTKVDLQDASKVFASALAIAGTANLVMSTGLKLYNNTKSIRNIAKGVIG